MGSSNQGWATSRAPYLRITDVYHEQPDSANVALNRSYIQIWTTTCAFYGVKIGLRERPARRSVLFQGFIVCKTLSSLPQSANMRHDLSSFNKNRFDRLEFDID